MNAVYPQDHPLHSASLKVKRANSHIKALNRSIGRALDPKVAFRIKGELQGADHPLRGAAIGQLTVTPHTLQSQGLLVGDVVSNLRASLDHIAWALAMKHRVGKPALSSGQEREVYFPLVQNRPTGGFKVSNLILPAAIHIIESFQPYNRDKRPELIRLAILDDLSRSDKHRVTLPSMRQVSVQLGTDQPMTFMALNKPTSMDFLIPPGESRNLVPYFTFDEVLHPTVVGLRGFSISQLPLIHDFIRDEVLPAFAGFFS